MAIPQTFIQELLARVDVVEVVGRHVQLKKAGANFMGLCPFHGEKSPSFSVSPSKQFYHCFGCGKNGDAIRFLMEHTGAAFREAVEDLAQQVGLQVPDDDTTPEERARAQEQRQRQVTLTEVLDKAGAAWRRQLRASPRAIDYCKRRGLSGDIARRFGLGYAPEGWRGLASVFPHYDDPLLVDSGLVIVNDESGEEKRYDRFRDRLMFPIRNVKGECIAFGGRVLGDEKPKYLNSPETPVFSKGRELYGLFEARDAVREMGYVLVTEGYMDVVALAQLGFPNAVATLGTACTGEHVHKLFRFTDAVVFSFDGDGAGRRAARKALEAALPYANDVRTVRFLFLPAEHDPDSFIRANGRDAFARCIDEAVPLSRFLAEAAAADCDLHTAEGRAHMAANARSLWSLLPDGALKRQLLAEIATQAQLGTADLAALWQGEPAPRPSAREAREPRDARPRPWRAPAAGERPGRARPASRADHAARLLLSDSARWHDLGNEDHAMLCELPAPHGPLFVWLEGQYHDQGPLPWGSLREHLRGEPFEELALRAMAGLADSPGEAATMESAQERAREAANELRGLLDLMQGDRLKAQETQALHEGDLDLYRALQERRRALLPRNPS